MIEVCSMAEVLFYVEGSYVNKKPEYCGVYDKDNNLMFKADAGIPLKAIVRHLEIHKNLKFIKHYKTKKLEELVLVFETKVKA
jgi:hypothetical protein